MSSFYGSTGTSRYGNTIGTSRDYLSTEQPFTGSKLITGEKGTIKEMIFDKEDDFLAAVKMIREFEEPSLNQTKYVFKYKK